MANISHRYLSGETARHCLAICGLIPDYPAISAVSFIEVCHGKPGCSCVARFRIFRLCKFARGHLAILNPIVNNLSCGGFRPFGVDKKNASQDRLVVGKWRFAQGNEYATFMICSVLQVDFNNFFAAVGVA